MNPHALDGARRWVWVWPLEKPTPELLADLREHGITGVVPQQGSAAIGWARAYAPILRAAGLDVCIGLGQVSAAHILRALDVLGVAGVMLDQEDWTSVPDSVAVVNNVLALRPEAPGFVADCFYPAADATEGGAPTGHGKIARAWAPLCGMRANQCYWEPRRGHPEDTAPADFVRTRLAWSVKQYAGIDPGDPIRFSGQLYRRTVPDHVATLFQERSRAVFLWHWRGADARAKAALRTLAASERPDFAGWCQEITDLEVLAMRAWGQCALNELAPQVHASYGGAGELPLVVDGVWGLRSAAALGRYQERNALPMSCSLDAATLESLQRALSGSCNCPHP